MEKAYCKTLVKKISVFFLCFTVCFFLFNACGLYADTDAINPPSSVVNQPGYSNIDFRYSDFSFYTRNQDNDNLVGVRFKGTDVYYRIYDNTSDLNSDVAILSSLINSEENSATAPTRMISLNYKPLKLFNNPNKSPLISYTTSNQKVVIRLTDYQNDSLYASRIELDGVNIGKPVRNLSESNLSFNFGRTGENDRAPLDSDEDVKISSTPTESGMWYVAMFAVGIGEDLDTYAPIYSNILYLGAVKISSLSEDN